MSDLDLLVHGIAGGGDGIATDAGGRVVFVASAIPGDRVRARLVEERSRFARAEVVELLAAGPGRIEPPCPHVAEGCGGCGWQHIEPAAQRALKATIVADALARIGHVDPPRIDPGPDLDPFAYRTTVRGLVADGRLAYRKAASHEPVGADGCLTAHPLVRELIDTGRFGAATEVVLRAGAATGERLVVADPSAVDVEVPAGVTVVGRDELRHGAPAAVHEVVAGRSWRVSARSFFQSRPDGAEALVAAVRAAVGDRLRPGSRLVDLYCGVGLFAGALAGPGVSVHAVEGDRSAVADARVNLADVDATVVKADVGRWHPVPADVVVADPARTGLGRDVVARVAATGASVVALVACDPAAFGRDAGLLAAAGYRLEAVTLVDLFPQTPHIEVVGAFRLSSAAGPGSEQ